VFDAGRYGGVDEGAVVRQPVGVLRTRHHERGPRPGECLGDRSRIAVLGDANVGAVERGCAAGVADHEPLCHACVCEPASHPPADSSGRAGYRDTGHAE
jgi:hypothetical protein